MVRRLVIVAVEENEVAIGDQSRQYDLIGRGGSVENEVGSFRAEYRCGLFLRLKGGALMGEKIAELGIELSRSSRNTASPRCSLKIRPIGLRL